MHYKSNLKLLVLSLVAMVFVFCGEEFVTKEFKNGVVDANFFLNETHAEQALTAVYDIISQKGLYREAIVLLGDAISDDINELTGDNGDYGTYFRAGSDYRWEPSNPFSTARWYDGYKGVFRANILLEKLPDIEMDESLKARFAGEAKFLRALFYHNLVNAFGDVPFVTSVLSREEYNELARTDKNTIYAQMEQDLIDAAAVLPIEAGDPVGRATKGAANALLGRIYMYQNKWQESVNASMAVVNQGTYQLVPSEEYITLFNGNNENSVESILEYQSVAQAPGFWGASSENFYSIHWSPVIGWANWYSPSPGSYQQFEEGDIRRKASVLVVDANPPDSIDTNGDGIREQFPSGNMNSSYFNGANTRKWLPEGKNMTQANSFDVNFIILRYAEVLLNLAEAQNELGNSAEALELVNMIRRRAQAPEFTETGQDALRQSIREERRRELVFEGQRFYDLQRWGLAAEVLGPLGYVVGRHEYWPVPNAELDLMENLTQYPN
ncbi:MAG: RagB/SusD family nutrient uptake outer membrane protein [Saprospiraceae bacterium]|nr:RagB/SusD family nutrient uptake outer membrane protein [Saprospiraceae bacterium]